MFNQTRPKPTEDEETILAQEKAFYESKRKAEEQREVFEPAATAVRKQGAEKVTINVNSQGSSSSIGESIAGAEKFELDQPIERVMKSGVFERSFDESKLMTFPTSKAAPTVRPIKKSLFATNKALASSNRSEKSLFARMFDANCAGDVTTENSKPSQSGNFANETKPDSAIGDSIHPYLSGMTESEILAEQRILVERLDPKMINFIRSRKNNKSVNESSSLLKSSENEMPSSSLPSESDLPINPVTVHGIPGMEKVEIDKLEWTGLVKESRPQYPKLEEGMPARFNFEGFLLTGSAVDEKSFESGLHHHGEEMEKPGYTMEELLTLSRSVNHQQKALALQIIGNIYAKAHTGMYDGVFDKSLFDLSEYTNFVFTIRKGLDEFDKTLINLATQCLANIIYPWEEEACLDMVYSWEGSKPHPWISTKTANMNATIDPGDQENDMKDFQMLEMDLLDFFIHRSNLLDRLNYFLKTDMLTEIGVDGVLKILIRISRHSPEAVIEHKELLGILVSNYTTPNWSNTEVSPSLRGTPLWMVFKILRILVDSSEKNASKILNDFKLFPKVLAFLAYDDWKSNTVVKLPERIIVECFRLWIAFISQGFAVDEYKNFFPILIKFLVLYQKIDLSAFDLIHSGYVFSLLLSILSMKEDSFGIAEKDKHSHWVLMKDCVSFIENLMIKLLTQLSSPQMEISSDVTIFWTLSRGLSVMNQSVKYDPSCMTLRFVTAMKIFLSSAVFQKLTSQLRQYSVILMPPISGNRYPVNFSSVNAIRHDGNCNPVLIFGNGLPLLTEIFSTAKILRDKIQLFEVVNDNVKAYVEDICKSNHKTLTADFFVRFELCCILKILELYPENSLERFHLAYKAVSEAPKCCSRLFIDLFKIAIRASCDVNELKTCNQLYQDYLLESEYFEKPDENLETPEVPTKKVKFSEDVKTEDGPSTYTIDFKHWTDRSVESHWILEPMEKIRTIATSVPHFLERNLTDITLQCKICLKMIGNCLKQHADFVIQTPQDFIDVYVAVSQVFLIGDPRIYIDADVSVALVQILKSLMNCQALEKSSTQPIFTIQRQSEGLNMFFDFYRNLVKEYSENSYFNEVFAAFLMIPLRIPEDAKLRSNFWTMETLKFVRIDNSLALIFINYLTSGIEKDPSMFKIYIRLLRSEKISKSNNAFLFDVIKTILQNGLNSNLENDEDLVKLKDSFLQLKI